MTISPTFMAGIAVTLAIFLTTVVYFTSSAAIQSENKTQLETLTSDTMQTSIAKDISDIKNNIYSNQNYQNGTFKVLAGAGGHAAPFTKYFPQKAEIKVGESVVWYNPTRVPEPHTVTFIFDNKYANDLASPFSMSNKTEFSAFPPGSNAEPVIMPDKNGTNLVIGINARALNPSLIDSAGNGTMLAPNSKYVMKGTEKYVNSGMILPEGKILPGFPPITSFTVKFDKAGTYDYKCILHPWMTGVVVVK